ncbi:hypothetical protein MPSEU_000142100 [Mayamaea pseudoterrestris]|nr:hypothetical protein MPSEU_000142100 [Mayamaea pseudoterrestris]
MLIQLRETSVSERTANDDSSTLTETSTTSSFQESSTSLPIQQSTRKNNVQFHQDMIRVLESRAGALNQQLIRARQRQRKPPLLSTEESDLDGADRVYSMLKHLVAIQAADETSFQLVMQAYCHRDRIRWYATIKPQQNNNATSTRVLRRAADRVEELLQELLTIVSPDQVSLKTYNIALQAYANCATPRGECNYASKAETLLEKMKMYFSSQQLVESKLLVLRTSAREQANLQGSACADRAQDLLNELIVDTLKHENSTRILMEAHNLVLEAWSKCGSEESVTNAETCLNYLKTTRADLADSDDDDAKQWFNADVYSNAILVWSKSNQVSAAERCNELLQEMLRHHELKTLPKDSEPSLIAFNGVILAYCRSGRFEEAEHILKVIESATKTCSNLSADVVSYNTILNAYLRSSAIKEKVALEKIRRLVQYMEDNRYEKPYIRPNCFSYKVLFTAWLQSGEPMLLPEAENLLFLIVRLWKAGDTSIDVNNFLFNKLINAYAKSQDPQATNKALKLLQQMKESQLNRPDIITYTSVLECLSNARQPSASDKAEELLQEVFALYEATGQATDRPNVRTFTMAIATLAKNQGNVLRTYELLQQLLQLYEKTKDPNLRPNTYPYNYVLNCAAYTMQSNKTEAFQIATKAFQALRVSDIVEPDCFTYAFWLSCCSNLLVRGSDLQVKCVSFAFKECKQKGLVSIEVIKRLCQGNRPQLVAKLLNVTLEHDDARRDRLWMFNQIRFEKLPLSWSANAPKKQR